MLKRGDDMKNIIKVMMVFICVVSLVACGKKDETVSTNKDGTLYEAGVGVSFYYPNDFQLSETDKSDGVIRFVKENQVLFYKVEKNEYDNDTTQLSELYKGELEFSGVSSLEVKTPALESGLKCYEYKGNYVENGLKFIHLVYFDEQNTYIYGYEANSKDFKKNYKRMIVYLESFAKTSGL